MAPETFLLVDILNMLGEVPHVSFPFTNARLVYLGALYQSQINDRYVFPEMLDLDIDDRKYQADSADRSTRNLFRLHSVLVHSGSTHGGHYYAFSRPDGQQWLRFDDEKVGCLHRLKKSSQSLLKRLTLQRSLFCSLCSHMSHSARSCCSTAEQLSLVSRGICVVLICS